MKSLNQQKFPSKNKTRDHVSSFTETGKVSIYGTKLGPKLLEDSDSAAFKIGCLVFSVDVIGDDFYGQLMQLAFADVGIFVFA